MTLQDIAATIQARASRHGVDVSESVLTSCAAYLELLATWNRRINLTSLPLDLPIPDATVDRLIIEPLLAARWVGSHAHWVDLGSGGGSPAVPLKLARPESSVVLVEARERKCAFLREVVRKLRLSDATVIQERFEVLGRDAQFDLATVRAVRMDAGFFELVSRLLRPDGGLIIFGPIPSNSPFVLVESLNAPGKEGSSIHLLARNR